MKLKLTEKQISLLDEAEELMERLAKLEEEPSEFSIEGNMVADQFNHMEDSFKVLMARIGVAVLGSYLGAQKN